MQLPFAVRAAGQRLFRHVPVRIRSGINQGLKWSVVTSGRGYGSGTFGMDRLAALEAVVQPGDCFWDIGAHKGFMTLAAAGLVGPSGSVVSLEPSERNLWFIRQHLSWNPAEQVRVIPGAVSDRMGESRFGGRGDSLAYSIGRGSETVAVRSVSDIVRDFGVCPPTVMKIDAEGEEAAVLRGAGALLGRQLALLISVHSRTLHEECTALLAAREFRLFESFEMARCSADPTRAWVSDHDLLAVGPDRMIDEGKVRALALIRGNEHAKAGNPP